MASGKILKNTIIINAKSVVVLLSTLIAVRFLLDGLGASDYGLYKVIGGIVSLMAILNSILETTTRRFITYELGRGDSGNLNIIFNTTLIIHVLIATLVFLLAETIGMFYVNNYLNVESGKTESAVFVLRLSALSIVTYILSAPYQGLLAAHEKFSTLSAIDAGRSILALGAAVVISQYSGNRLNFYATLIFFVSFIRLLSICVYCHNAHKHTTKIIYPQKSSYFSQILSFSFWVLFGKASSIAEKQGSAVIVNLFFGTLLNASFGIAQQVKKATQILSESLIRATAPQITKSFAGGETRRSVSLALFGSKFSFFLMLMPALLLIFETNYILNLWLTDVPEYTTVFIQLVALQSLIIASSSGIPPLIYATGKIKLFQLITNGLLLAGLPITFLLYKAGYQPYYLLIVYSSLHFLKLFIRLWLLKRVMDFEVSLFIKKGYLKMLPVFTIAVIAVLPIALYVEESFGRLLLTFMATIVSVVISVWFIGVESTERRNIKSYFKHTP